MAAVAQYWASLQDARNAKGNAGFRQTENVHLGRWQRQSSYMSRASSRRSRVRTGHRLLLQLYLQQVELIDKQIAVLEREISMAMRPHQAAIERLADLPGVGVNSAHQIIAEMGPEAATFPSAGQAASWVGACPGREESAGESHNNRSPKGNRPMRRLLNQLAWAAVRTKESYFQDLFRRLVVRLGRHCPDGVNVFFDNVGGEILDIVLAQSFNLRSRSKP